MGNIRIKNFFNSRYFEIPKYQRGYAWERKNIRELLDDILEAIEVKASHYIGTIVLSKTEKSDDIYFVVDGQQRIATLTMIVNNLINYLDNDDASFYRRFYIKRSENFRLIPLGKENDFFKELLTNGDKNLTPQNRSQRLLLEAYDEINTRIKKITNEIDALKFIEHIENLQIMEFVEENEGDAIRIFQTVNDRGKPLTNMEKAKSLLVYFSNRYLNKKLDKIINDTFGDIFEIYDEIKNIGEINGIDLISGRYGEFDEDNIMRYHFITFSDENYDPSASYVLDFLKRKLNEHGKNGNSTQNIENFITSYVNSLLQFFTALNNLIKKTETEEKYFKIFSILGLSATLYPLVTKLEEFKLLENSLIDEDVKNYKMLDLIEIIDVRVYKIRGTDPKAEISRFIYQISNENWTKEDIENWLYWYNERWMNENEFRNNIQGSIYKRSRAVLPHLLLDYSESLANKKFGLKELKNFVKSKALTIEHILSQEPKFTLRTHGFKSTDEFLEYEHSIGNLTILEKGLNSGARNKNVFDKVPYYDRSIFKMTKILATNIMHTKQFKKFDIENRIDEISEYFEVRWWCKK